MNCKNNNSLILLKTNPLPERPGSMVRYGESPILHIDVVAIKFIGELRHLGYKTKGFKKVDVRDPGAQPLFLLTIIAGLILTDGRYYWGIRDLRNGTYSVSQIHTPLGYIPSVKQVLEAIDTLR